MTIAIIGAGIQGCCVALELTRRGHDIVLFDRAARPMEGASRWNEGKIHLGYIYANEASLATAQLMIRGAMVFRRRLRTYLEETTPAAEASTEYVYAVHRDSLLSADEVSRHIRRVDPLVAEALALPDSDYLGRDRVSPSRSLTNGGHPFDDAYVQRAIHTPELAIDTRAIADRMAVRVLSDPMISVMSDCRVRRIVRADDGSFRLQDAAGLWHGPFEAVVNASWESRIALDRTVGQEPDAPWLHRYKLGLYTDALAGAEDIPSVTLMLGPFGDVVNFGRGRLYLSWYPACMVSSTSELQPLEPDASLDEHARWAIAARVIEELRAIVPALRSLPITRDDVVVRGGHIFAWGATDITDIRSRLHQRHDVGVDSRGGYHSIDTGKYCLAPLHAVTVADRIAG